MVSFVSQFLFILEKKLSGKKCDQDVCDGKEELGDLHEPPSSVGQLIVMGTWESEEMIENG